jgi:hypothetical protein
MAGKSDQKNNFPVEITSVKAKIQHKNAKISETLGS